MNKCKENRYLELIQGNSNFMYSNMVNECNYDGKGCQMVSLYTLLFFKLDILIDLLAKGLQANR